ncbi:hypothetical protein J2T60_001221 [Natronospira proteinivora]|uniref:DUF4411 family protein n=1 Tax=Natronospira proteinivora TaxID=1807133 RepID=A0ABT1G7H8_9GAMM|nr:DUF4411 family protein [Natronospira proteinivora]MCP1727256.1 hypothetical protein [Natronospira proteinivora]
MYIIDSDVLITAKNSYYAFDLCPGFWASLLERHQAERVYSLDRNRMELLQGREDDDLVSWINNLVPDSFFLSTRQGDVATAYTDVMMWAQRNAQYFDAAKAKFATGADGWLVAYAYVYGCVVVTLEESRPESRNQIKLPDVCIQFGVPYENVFTMLRALEVQFN